jgi:hypothetical protein
LYAFLIVPMRAIVPPHLIIISPIRA